MIQVGRCLKTCRVSVPPGLRWLKCGVKRDAGHREPATNWQAKSCASAYLRRASKKSSTLTAACRSILARVPVLISALVPRPGARSGSLTGMPDQTSSGCRAGTSSAPQPPFSCLSHWIPASLRCMLSASGRSAVSSSKRWVRSPMIPIFNPAAASIPPPSLPRRIRCDTNASRGFAGSIPACPLFESSAPPDRRSRSPRIFHRPAA